MKATSERKAVVAGATSSNQVRRISRASLLAFALLTLGMSACDFLNWDDGFGSEPKNQEFKIAFVSNRDGNSEIYSMNPGGDHITRLTNHPAADVFPDLSPDGNKLLFTSFRTGGFADLYIIDVNTPEPTGSAIALTSNPLVVDGAGVWSPDGKKIAFHSTRHVNLTSADNPVPHLEIYLMDVITRETTRLTTSNEISWFPFWSPDGTRLSFLRGAKVENGRLVREIWTMNADGSNQKFLTEGVYRHDWSSDGRQIVYPSNHEGFFGIYKINVAGGQPISLTPIPEGVAAANWSHNQPKWANNNKHIYFEAVRPETNGQTEIFRMNADGTDIKQITENPAYDGQPAVRSVRRGAHPSDHQ